MIAEDRDSLRRVWQRLAEAIQTEGAQDVTWKPAQGGRSAAQNRAMWGALWDIAAQVEWPVDGRLERLSADCWKHILSAGLKRHQRVAAGIDGGFVILGQRTSKMRIKDMADLLTLIHAFGNERGVNWSDPEFQSLMEAEAAK